MEQLMMEEAAVRLGERRVLREKHVMARSSVTQRHFVRLAWRWSLVCLEEQVLMEQKVIGEMVEDSGLRWVVAAVEAVEGLMVLSPQMVEVAEVHLAEDWKMAFAMLSEEAVVVCW